MAFICCHFLQAGRNYDTLHLGVFPPNDRGSVPHGKVKDKKSNPITGLDKPRGFQEVEAPRFQDNRHMKVVRLSALRIGRLYPPRKYSWYSFLLEAESTPGPYCGRKDNVNEKFH